MKPLKILFAVAFSLTLASCDNTSDDEPGLIIDPVEPGLERVKVTVVDYSPAPGQFVNELPRCTAGETRESVIKKVEAVFNGTNDSQIVTLGAFGGSITVRTERPVTGKFQVIGNPIPTQGEPGIVAISSDGTTWYNLRGEKFDTAREITVTYHQPAANATDAEYIRWETSDGQSGYLSRIPQFHTQNYFPEWNNNATLTFTALRLPDNGAYNPATFQWELTPMTGYADNFPNSDERSLLDPANAVDASGKSVRITSFSYIRITTSTLQNCGPIGEASTEVGGIKVLTHGK